jgi:hypothetical protein
MDPDFVNVYVETLVNEVTELSKIRMVHTATITHLEKKLAAANEALTKHTLTITGTDKAPDQPPAPPTE